MYSNVVWMEPGRGWAVPEQRMWDCEVNSCCWGAEGGEGGEDMVERGDEMYL